MSAITAVAVPGQRNWRQFFGAAVRRAADALEGRDRSQTATPDLFALAAAPGAWQDIFAGAVAVKVWPFADAPAHLRAISSLGNDETTIVLVQSSSTALACVLQEMSGPRGIDAAPVTFEGESWQCFVLHSR